MTYREFQQDNEKINLGKHAKFSINAKRWKEDSEDNYRMSYQRDISRILFSDAFRGLRMKTQVFTASGLDQHNRTRMTHSLEVSQIAKSIGRPLRLNTDLVEAIALGHDLGHTPFGHAGERALNDCVKARTGGSFNHNAQSVWLVRTAHEGRKDLQGKPYRGLNLTHDTVEGIWKHTKIKESLNEFDDLKFYKPDDEKGFAEAQVVNIADRIAYTRHDIEDALKQKIILPKSIESVWKNHFDTKFDKNNWVHEFIYDLINNNFNKTEISFSPEKEKALKAIRDFSTNYVLRSQNVEKSDQESYDKICMIFEHCIKNEDYLAGDNRKSNKLKIEMYGIERAAVDYIQWCGDELANMICERIKKTVSK